MKIKAKREIIYHRGEVFCHRKEGEIWDEKNSEILRDLGDLVKIVDYFPHVAEYRILKAFLNHQPGDVISLFGDEAAPLVLKGFVEPLDEKIWRPGRELPHSKKNFLGRIRNAFSTE